MMRLVIGGYRGKLAGIALTLEEPVPHLFDRTEELQRRIQQLDDRGVGIRIAGR